MKQEKFEKHLEYLMDKINSTLMYKASQYADWNVTDDRLYNFKQIASLMEMTTYRALLTLFSKHFIVIKDWFIKDTHINKEEFEERIIDCINYLILSYMLYQEHESR